MRTIRIFLLSFLTLFSLATYATPLQVTRVEAASPTPSPSASGTPTPGKCVESGEDGVLVKKTFEKGSSFRCYLYALLSQNMPVVILVAIVLVVYSGVEYIVAMGNATQQTKAKQRILAILGGVIFYFLIEYITRLLANDLVFNLAK